MSLENKGRIRILRGNASNENVKTVSLYAGQPFYDTSSKHLYIGDGNNINESAPIIADANNIIFYCETAGDVSKKTIELPGYKLINGQKAFIMFKNTNTSLDITLNINKLGDKSIYYNNQAITYKDIKDLKGYTVDWGGSCIDFSTSSGSFNIEFTTLSGKVRTYYNQIVRHNSSENLKYGSTNGIEVYNEVSNGDVIDGDSNKIQITGGDSVNTDFITYFLETRQNMTTTTKPKIYLTVNKDIRTDDGLPHDIKSNTLYQLEYKNNAFYISELAITNSTYATYASEDISKGTIEERLTNLGFKQGAITVYGDGTQNNYFVDRSGTTLAVGTQVGTITRQGNYCIINCKNLYLNSKAEAQFTTYLKIDDYNKYFKGAPDVGITGVYAEYASGEKRTTRVGYAGVVGEQIQVIIRDTTNILAAGSNPTSFGLNFGYQIRNDSQ